MSNIGDKIRGNYYALKIKTEDHAREVIFGVVVFLVGACSFFLGYLVRAHLAAPQIVIQKNSGPVSSN